ncbi:MAG: PilW family protein [Alcanivorax sediminis]|uniref:PilW family protein n=1 Tax=Alcanivorax sediminis TaxID=2663008 RepID=UPI003C38C6DF
MRRAKQKGFSLIELMVALLLGTLITAAAVQMFITNQRSFRLQQTMSEVQETGRFAAEIMAKELRVAGLTRADGTQSAGVIVQSGFEGGAGATSNDQLRFQYFGTMDCEGDLYTGSEDDALIENRYSVTSDGDLVCVGMIDANNDGSFTGGEVDTDSVTLVSNVDSFQVQYGVDRPMTAGATADDGIPYAGNYLRADQLSVGELVVSVRIGILVRASRDSDLQTETPRGFTVLDQVLKGGVAPLDAQAVRRLFIRTIKLRNYRWDSV